MRIVGGVMASGATKNVDIVRVFGSLSGIEHSTAANDQRPSASFSARKNPQRISANTPSVFHGLAPLIWPHLFRLVTNGNVGQAPRH